MWNSLKHFCFVMILIKTNWNTSIQKNVYSSFENVQRCLCTVYLYSVSFLLKIYLKQ